MLLEANVCGDDRGAKYNTDRGTTYDFHLRDLNLKFISIFWQGTETTWRERNNKYEVLNK